MSTIDPCSHPLMQVDMMEELGLDVKVIESRWGEGADEEKLAAALKVTAHCESNTSPCDRLL